MGSEETVEQVCDEMRGVKTGQHANGGRLYERYMMKCQIAEEYADRILAARKREIIVERNLSNDYILGLLDKIAATAAENAKLRKLVNGLLEASSVACADCNYDCGPNRENCIIREAAKYIEEGEAKKSLSLKATDGVTRYYDYHGKLVREEQK